MTGYCGQRQILVLFAESDWLYPRRATRRWWYLGMLEDTWISMGGHNRGAAVEVDAIGKQQLKQTQSISWSRRCSWYSYDQTSAQRAAQCWPAYVGE